MKVDILLPKGWIPKYDDANKEDESWDPVWDMQTNMLPDGWSAEIKVPFRIAPYNVLLLKITYFWSV